MAAREPVSVARGRSPSSSPTESDMSMMRVAVAGTGGLARLIAHYIDEDTSHQVVFLSRTVRSTILASIRQRNSSLILL